MLKTMMVAVAIAAGAALAQAPEAAKSADSPKYYKLDFVVKEVEGGKVLNARAYSLLAAAGESRETASIRTGNRVPYKTLQMGQNSQYQYADVGVNIDCRSIRELQRELALWVSAEVSSAPTDAAPTADSAWMPPSVRQNRWSSAVVVPLKKPTLIFSSDDPASKRQMQLELTATPIGQ